MDPSGDRPVTIVSAEDHVFELNLGDLESMLLKDNIRDKRVVLVSVAGAYRKGKSFLLNFMLRYLNAQGSPTWLGNDNEPLKGFSWRGGSERDTTGILIWSKVFLVPLPSGEEVAVLLMDTQGVFDSSSPVKDCATVFALSTMLSSIQIYNLSQNIQEDDLQHLELFADYGRLALEDTHETPFQKLMFLVRDWSYPYDAPFGNAGGQIILQKRLQITDKLHPQLQQLRRHIKACFGEVTCFLMPHPGLEVATSSEFDGKLADIRDEFKEQLRVLMPKLLASENLVPKRIGGRYITAKELITYFKSYVAVFEGDQLPEPKTMLQATAEANNLAAMACAKDCYTSAMENICGGSRPYLNNTDLERKHLQAKETAVQQFVSTRRMGSAELSMEYQEKLQKDLEELFTSYIRFNDGKKMSNILRTPATLFCTIVAACIVSYFLSAICLDSMTFFTDALLGVCLVSLLAWAYARYSGEYQTISDYIDNAVAYFLINFVFPGQRAIMDKLHNHTEAIESSIASASSRQPQSQSTLVHRRAPAT